MTNTHPLRFRNYSIFLILIIALCTFSCKKHRATKKHILTTDFSYEPFIEKMETIVSPADTLAQKGIKVSSGIVKYTYFVNDFYPIWLSHGYKTGEAADKFIDELKDVKWDGLDPENYGLTNVIQLKAKLGKKETTLDDAIAFDTALTKCYLAVAKDLLIGKIVPKKADSLWYHANDSTWNAPRLLADMQQKYTPLDEYRSTVPTYKLLRGEYKHYWELAQDSNLAATINGIRGIKKIDSDAIASITAIINKEAPWITPEANDSVDEWTQLIATYQDYRGIKPTGKTDSTTLLCLATAPDSILSRIAANMERIRWMQQQFGNLYVLVNVPLMQLFLRKNGLNAMHMRVVVGKPERQTPSLYALMTNVVINPTWGVPSTILKQDVLPGIEKSGSKYMAKKGLKVYTRDGKLVNVAQVNSKNYRKFQYKQAAGDDNSLGNVKFNLPNPWDIYLHDTPHRGDFVKRFRALSSGCIRLNQPREMAVFILSELEKKDFTRGKLDTIISTHKTQWRVLSNKIPVHIAYLTAFEDTTGTHINFINDVYHRDEKLIVQLAKTK